jgi:2-keto-3-deoxy-L-rhamnonate aldolase RhmA
VIGPNDLSLSLGISGEPKHPRMVEAYERVIAACRQHGVAPGVHLMDMGWAEEWIAKGMRFLTYYTDIRPAGRRRERYPPASGEPGPEEIAGESKSQTKSRIKASGRAGSRV